MPVENRADGVENHADGVDDGHSVELEYLSLPSELLAIREEWDEFAASVARPSPFQTADWLAERWRSLGLDGRIVVARRSERIAAALPLSVSHGRTRVGTFLAGPYAGVDLMQRAGEPLSAASAVVAGLAPVGVGYLELVGFPRNSALERVVPLRPAPLRLDGAPSLAMKDGWDEAYRRQTSAKRRTGHRRNLAKLRDVGEVLFRTATTPAEIATAIERTFDLHDLRWQQRSETDLSNYTVHKEFHRNVAQGFARLGRVCIVLLELDGRAIAFNYYFRFAGTMFIHRLAFDPFYADYSPGQLVTLFGIEQASQEGLTRVEFLRGEESYKLQLADHVDDYLWATCLSQNAVGRIAARQRALKLRLRQRAKAVRRRRAQ